MAIKKSDPDAFIRRIESWQDLSNALGHFSEFNGYDWLFRGVTDESRDLTPKVGRPRKKGSVTVKIIPYSLRDEKAVLAAFRQHARPFIQGDHTSIEWMAIAQHFGVPTRLLDWSDSLLAAAWFAVQEPRSADSDGAIWVTRAQLPLDPDYVGDPFDLKNICIYRPPHISPRMSSQGSVLMLCPTPTLSVQPDPLHKIIVDGKQRFQLRKRLDACGINEKTIYADLAGVGQHFAWRHQNNWLSGYRLPSSASKRAAR
jgi:hypothetical protein